MIETVLLIHILSAAAWIGGGFLNLFLGPRMAKAGGPVTIAWIQALIEAASRYFTTAGTLTLLSGIGLVLVMSEHGFTDPFVITGIVVVVVALGIVGAVLTPATKAALAAAEGGDFPAAGANARRAARAAQTNIILLVLAEIVMVFQI